MKKPKKMSEGTRTPVTHFEQIPVEVVKKVVVVETASGEAAGNLDMESSFPKTEPYIEWKRSF